MPLRPTFGAFNQGNVPTIACFNKATVALGVDLDKPIAAMQVFVSAAKKNSFAKEDRRGHRSEQRKRAHLLRVDPKAIARCKRET
jgi:hypothetical protein